MTNTAQRINWQVHQIVPNVEGKVVGRQRKPRPFLVIVHDVDSCEAAFTLARTMGLDQGKAGVRVDGMHIPPVGPAHDEYRAFTAKVRGER